MIDYQRVVDEIRSFLQSVDQTNSDHLRELAAEYAEACKEANRRLRRCDEFLQKGLRSEAIHLAQAEPVLLDMVATLDFPELDTWREITVSYGLPAAPRLSLTTAEALNEAYTVVQPLEHLLRKHRLLALAHAPLPERMAVMRQIAALDSGNPVWTEDLRAFENVRVRQLEQEVEAALHNQDSQALERAFGEIRSSPWVSNPPVQLIQRVEHLNQQANQQRVHETLQVLEAEIHAAVAAYDVDRVRRLRDRWNAEALRGNLSLEDPIWGRVASAFDWLGEQEKRRAEERRHQNILHKLDAGLNDGAPPQELEKLYRAAVAFAGALPEPLEQRYHDRLRQLRSVQGRRWRRNLALCVLAGLILGAVAVYLMRESIQDSKIRDAAQKLRSIRDAGQWNLAVEELKRIDDQGPRIAEAPIIVQLRAQIMAEVEREQRRVATFKQAIEDARAAPLEDHEKETHAQGLALRPEEKQAVGELVRSRTEQRKQQQEQREQGFLKRAHDLETQLNELRQKPADALASPTVDALLKDIDWKIALLGYDAPLVDPKYRDLPATLRDSLAAVRDIIRRHNQEGESTTGLTADLRASNGGAEYARALEQYVKQFPGSARTKNFQLALKDRPLWLAAREWNRLFDPDHPRPLELKFADARELANKLRAFQADHSASFYDAPVARAYLLYLEALGQQDESVPKTAARELRELFDRIYIRNVWALVEQDRDGEETRTYYLAEDPAEKLKEARDEGRDLVGIHHLSGLEGKDAVKNISLARVTKIFRAPQSKLAEFAQRMPKNFADPTWEAGTLKLAQAIREARDIDPVLQLSLLDQVLALAARGSYPLAQALEPVRQKIKEANVDVNVPWLNPVSDSASRSRPKARRVVEQLPAFQTAGATAAGKKRELEQALTRSRRELAGWLAWEKDAGWQCRSPVPLAGDHTLGVLCPAADQPAIWKPVGKLVNGKATFTNPQNSDLLEGRLLFAEAATVNRHDTKSAK
jgi:hypothetical protein